MDEQNSHSPSPDRSTGRAVMGALLVAAGAALLVERLGAMPATWRNSIWPMLLVGFGVARLLQPRAEGREGLSFVLGGAWWLAGTAGWISLQRTWPALIVALGVGIMFQAVTATSGADVLPGHLRGRRGGSGAPWLLLVILIGAGVSAGIGRHGYAEGASRDGALRVYAVLGGSRSHLHATSFTGGEAVTIMGGSTIDLHDVSIAPGQTVTLDVFTLMGGGSIRVPDSWIVDLQVTPVLGSARDQRLLPADGWADAPPNPGSPAPASGAAPRLVVHGTIVMGALVIKS